MMAKLPPFPLATFGERLEYSPVSGLLTWRVSPSSNVRVGQVAGVRLKIGYRKIVVNDVQFYAHHVAWYLHTGEWPVEMIDHINGDKDDNRACNLRLATQSQQNFNTKASVKNTSGRKGVAKCPKTGRWRAYIMLNRKQKFLGNHSTFDDAVAARERAEVEICGEFVRAPMQEATHHAQDLR